MEGVDRTKISPSSEKPNQSQVNFLVLVVSPQNSKKKVRSKNTRDLRFLTLIQAGEVKRTCEVSRFFVTQ